MAFEAVNLQVLPEGKNSIQESKETKVHLTNTPNDWADMHRLGKKQEFKRNFHLISITAFSTIAMCSWLFAFISTSGALTDGASGGFIVMFLVNFFAFAFIVWSLAEMASIAPTAGGQYHWTSEFSPPSMQRFLSYLAGWLSTLSWLCGVSSGMFVVGALVEGMIIQAHPNFSSHPYQSYLLTVAFAAFSTFLNGCLSRFLPKLENFMAFVFSAFFITLLVVLWVMSPRLSASEVFTTFKNDGGWSSLGLSLMAGQSTLVYMLIGSDATAHMAEETRDAGSMIPKAMVSSYVISGILAFPCVITFCFCLVDLDAALSSPTGYAFMHVFLTATKSPEASNALSGIMLCLVFFSATNYMTATSRQVFAFARDQGLPFGGWLSKVNPATGLPLNSVWLVFIFVILINLITLGSSIAFNAIISLQLLALVFTYMISIACLIHRRLNGPRLPTCAWSLGPSGLYVNIVALAYCIYLVVFLPFPLTTPVTASSFNWAPVIFVAVMSGCLVYYAVWARKLYEGPVTYVRREG